MKEKILVAMSGGVDSSVAAALLLEQGHEVHGAYMKNWINEPGIAGDCPWQEDIEDARAATNLLGIPFRIVNLMDQYQQKVVSYLLEGYQSGSTPNPDVMCNREIKFGAFLGWALRNDYSKVATGHYARLVSTPNGEVQLWEGTDKNKDQSYFLALLQQEQLQRALMPLGNLTKPEVRELAKRFQLPNATKKDSQGICFVGKVRMRDFLRTYLPDQPGPVVDQQGNRLGTHQGLHLYTLGQRRGVGVASPVFGQAYVVVEKRRSTNELVLCLENEEAKGLYSASCKVGQLSFPGSAPVFLEQMEVRPRYRAPAVPAKIQSLPDGEWEVHFQDPQRALTPGQIAAFYRNEQLLVGGVISSVCSSLPPSRNHQPEATFA